MKTRRMREGERLSLDRISTLPQSIIDTILSLLYTKEAARTSILSKEWRYKWTTVPKLQLSHDRQWWCKWTANPKLELYHDRPPVPEKTPDMRCKPCNDIHQILLLHQGPIQELILKAPRDGCLEFDQIVLHLSKIHFVKKLRVYGSKGSPLSIFSFRHLTDMHLSCAELDQPPPIFNGFGSLQRLRLWIVWSSIKTLLHLLSKCPSLKTLSLFRGGPHDLDDKCTINELFECLPTIEHLTMWSHAFRWLLLDSVPKVLPNSLIHLKYFCFEEMCFEGSYGLSFLSVLLKCSPNLEKIKLQNETLHRCDEEYPGEWQVYSDDVWKDYSDVWLEHLNELEIEFFNNYKPEMEFVKFILARSPKLKKVILSYVHHRNQELKMLKTLLEAPRLSPVVITVR